MEDITPALIKTIKDEFHKELRNSQKVNAMYQKIRDGTATYTDADKFAVEVGNILSKIFKLRINSDMLPDGTMYYNIAERLMNDILRDNHKVVSGVASDVQTVLNKAAGMGISGIVPDIDQKRIDGFIERLASGELFDDIAWILGEPVVNYTQSVVTDTLVENAKFLNSIGERQIITRTLGGGFHDKNCKWCQSLAGSYEYPNVPREVFQRHDNCRCNVNSFDGKMLVRGNAFIKASSKTQEEKERERRELEERNRNRMEFIERMVAQGWTRKDAAIYFNKNRIWLE